MRLLALETSQTTYSIALSDGGGIVTSHTETAPHRQAEDLLPAIDRLLVQAGLNISAIDGYAVTVGPGSFTGIRTALAAIIGLNIATLKPVYSLSTLEVLAFQLRSAQPQARGYEAIINAYRGQWYHQQFAATLTPLTEPALGNTLPMGGHNVVYGGLGIPDDAPASHQRLARLQAEALALLTHEKIVYNQPFLAFEPLYIRKPDAKLSSRPPLTRSDL
jgi:tRNA threonylcarbamoyl adenosine modification protein YeaZ